jgi:thiaminase/transcriptional activator TenA
MKRHIQHLVVSITMSSCFSKIPKCTQDFWDAAKSMIDVTSKHPFLVAMIDGTLTEANFQYYVVQDSLYLQDFADCLRQLAASAPTSEDLKRLESFATGAKEAEMALHNSFFKEWNFKRDADAELPLVYLLHEMCGGHFSHAQGLAALLPCFWVYMHGTHHVGIAKEYAS